MKRQDILLEKILAKYIPDKGLKPQFYKKTLKAKQQENRQHNFKLGKRSELTPHQRVACTAGK